jgi:hypothetical protein
VLLKWKPLRSEEGNMDFFTRFKDRSHIKTAKLMKSISLDFLNNIMYDTLPKIGISIKSVYPHEILILGICMVKYMYSTLHNNLQNISEVVEEYHKVMEDYIRTNLLIKGTIISDTNNIIKISNDTTNIINLRYIEYSNAFLDDVNEKTLLKNSIELLAKYCFIEQVKGDIKRSFIVFASIIYTNSINKCIKILN